MHFMRNKTIIPICIALSILGAIATVDAHENSPHKGTEEAPKHEKQDATILQAINVSYLKDVKPIFQKSCFDCHSSNTNYPWYSKLPGAKQVIDTDIKESKEHLDLSNDFPFGGHGTPAEDLVAIQKALDDESMPPFRYWIMHPRAKLTENEKAAIGAWVQKSLTKLDSVSKVPKD